MCRLGHAHLAPHGPEIADCLLQDQTKLVCETPDSAYIVSVDY